MNRIALESIQWIVSQGQFKLVRSKVETRLFAEGDLRALYAIEEACFEPPVRFSRALMRSLAHDMTCRTWLGMVDDVRVGFAIVSLREQSEAIVDALGADGAVADGLVGEATAYLWTIEVLPAFRRMGVARQLLMRVEESARGAECAAIELHVSERNPEAAALYEVTGFVQVGIEAEFYGRGENAFRYRKSIRER